MKQKISNCCNVDSLVMLTAAVWIVAVLALVLA
jgi:hypothetical protein